MFRQKRFKAPEVLGRAILDQWRGLDKGMIRVSTSIAEPQIMDPALFFRDYDEMPEWEKLAMENCSGRILDVGAGAGPHCLYLQQNGIDCVAIEASDDACLVMQERGVEQIVKESFLDYRPTIPFDTILFLMNGTGLAGSLSELPMMLQHARSMLAEGGKILIDSTDILYMFEEKDGSLRINLASGYYGEMLMWVKYSGMRSENFIWLYADVTNLSTAAEAAGLETEIIYTEDSGRYLASLSASSS